MISDDKSIKSDRLVCREKCVVKEGTNGFYVKDLSMFAVNSIEVFMMDCV